jgi:hypothetical protein
MNIRKNPDPPSTQLRGYSGYSGYSGNRTGMRGYSPATAWLRRLQRGYSVATVATALDAAGRHVRAYQAVKSWAAIAGAGRIRQETGQEKPEGIGRSMASHSPLKCLGAAPGANGHP